MSVSPKLNTRQVRAILSFVGQVKTGEKAFAHFRLDQTGTLIVDTNKAKPFEIRPEPLPEETR